jgi:hypothetical protein
MCPTCALVTPRDPGASTLGHCADLADETLVPVRRFRSIEEMSGDHWYPPGSDALHRALRRIWALGHRTIQPHFPPGLYKHRTLEDMNALQRQWERANFEAYQARLADEKMRRQGD